MRVLIVGGVAGGASAAARLRRLDEAAEIILFEKANTYPTRTVACYTISAMSSKTRKALLQTPEAMRRRFNIDVRIRSEVLSIDRMGKKRSVRDHGSGNDYEKTMIS